VTSRLAAQCRARDIDTTLCSSGVVVVFPDRAAYERFREVWVHDFDVMLAVSIEIPLNALFWSTR
jgi:hypothetical protein